MTQSLPFTANRLINLAAKLAQVLGVGQNLPPSNFQDVFDMLNMMMAEWAELRLNVYHLIDVTFTADGSISYSIGPGGAIDTIYPTRIDGAQFTQNGIVYPLGIIHAKEDFRKISIPTLVSFPEYIFLDTSYPLASVSVWPIPNYTYSITMQLMAQLQTFDYATDVVNLKPIYRNALIKNLAVAICPLFGIEPSPTLLRGAATSKQSMQKANTQISLLQMDRTLIRNGHYNIYSDRST